MGTPTLQPHTPAAARSDVVDLSVVIVNYNVREFLEQALRSVQRAGAGINMEVFVVDNNSVDGSPAMVREQFPDVQLIANARNVGFGTANNQALRQARGRYALVLNPDTIVQEDTFEKLIRFMDDQPDAGAVGCTILHPDGSFALESRRAFPTPSVAFYRLIGLASAFPGSPVFGRYNMMYLPRDEVAEVDALSGSCMLVRRRALFGEDGAGLFDEDFFMYGEDLDLCYRIQQAGWKIYYTPETQIIHYKGESTKKGDLTYVRLFYGAMLRFTEKHFEGRYSGLFALALRLAIMGRAALSVLGKTTRSLAWPALDFVTVYVAAVATAMMHAYAVDAGVAPLYFGTVAPAYALGSVGGIVAAGGYGHRRRIRPVWTGVFVGFLVVASASFFIKDIAFSRAVILLTYPLAAVMATASRLVMYRRNRQATNPRRAVLVGARDEALRLQRMLARHPQPPMSLEGYVWTETEGSEAAETETAGTRANGEDEGSRPPRIGHLDQLRDLIRLRDVDEVIFASATLSNQDIFRHIQQLGDVAAHVRILAADRDHVIGKASVDDLSMVDLVEAHDALAHTRPRAARRLFEICLSLVGLLIHPFASLVARFSGPDSLAARLSRKTRKLPAVLTGQLRLVGYAGDAGYTPPPEWNLKPAVFPVVDALDFQEDDRDVISTAYWFYVRNESASLDWDVIMRSLRQARERA
ncbi:MAG: glycosyltransferase [Rhodothermales bacterium]